MQASPQIKDFIGRLEGCKLLAYKPLSTDRWTIGYGSTYYTPTDPVQQGDTISQDTADELLSDRVDAIAQGLSLSNIPNSVTQNQFDAVVSLVYNIGLTGFKSSATGKLFYAGLSISDKFAQWNKSDGKIITGLVVRRAKEKDIYDNSNYNS